MRGTIESQAFTNELFNNINVKFYIVFFTITNDKKTIVNAINYCLKYDDINLNDYLNLKEPISGTSTISGMIKYAEANYDIVKKTVTNFDKMKSLLK